jgi:hypothetical protein
VYSIGATNNKGLVDSQELSYTAYATQYSLSGPSSGNVNIASTNFTVALPTGGVIIGSVTVTPDDGGDGGTFTPTSVALTTADPSKTFTYTPETPGAKTISVTNSGGLTNPANIVYTSVGLVDGDPVSTWADQSGNGNDATMTGSNRPIYKTNIVNGKPIVRFSTAGASKLDLTTPISGAAPWRVFAVMQHATAAGIGSLEGSDGGNPRGPLIDSSNLTYIFSRDGYMVTASPMSAGWHVIDGIYVGSLAGQHFIGVDGTSVGSGTLNALPNSGDFTTIGYENSTPAYGDGDIAEIIIYAAALSPTDDANINKYLGDKYGITVAGGGTAVQPDTVTGLVGWWKADRGLS